MPETNFFWDPLSDNILQERDEVGAVTAEYTAEPGLYGNLISQNRQGVESQYHFDAAGSTLALSADNQQVTDTYACTAFGEVVQHAGGTLNPFQYQGQRGKYRDEVTGQYLDRRDVVFPALGRWLTLAADGGQHSGLGYIVLENAPGLRLIHIVFHFCTTSLIIKPGGRKLRGECGENLFQEWDFLVEYVGSGVTPPPPTGPPCKGYIVQRVKWNCVSRDCTTGKEVAKEDLYYLEAWQLEKDKITPRIRKKGATTDKAEYQPTLGTEGSCSQEGEIRFYCINERDDPRVGYNGLGTDNLHVLWGRGPFGKGDCLIRPGVLPAHLNREPWFWKDEALAGPLFRSFRVNWCCCGRKGMKDFEEAEASPTKDPKPGADPGIIKTEKEFHCGTSAPRLTR